MIGKSDKMKKLCGRVNTHPVSETLDNYPKNGDDPDSPYLRLLYDIAECIDSYEFQKASIIEKRFIKSEINEFSRLAMEREWDTADNTIRRFADNSLYFDPSHIGFWKGEKYNADNFPLNKDGFPS